MTARILLIQGKRAVIEGLNESTGQEFLALLSQEGSVIETPVEITRGEVPKPHA